MDYADFAAAVDRHYPGLIQRLTLALIGRVGAEGGHQAVGHLLPHGERVKLSPVKLGRQEIDDGGDR